MRRWAWLAVVVALMVTVTQQLQEAPVVTTLLGRVSGVTEVSNNGRTFYSYYAIPFARPPVGGLRFKDPVAPERWEGVREGKAYAEICPQYDTFSQLMGGEPSLLGSEDCLYLNVFTPQVAKTGEGLPVMVYIHGGAFFAGHAKIHPPHLLLDEDIVLVTIQYRLGVFGFLSTEDKVIPGNFGLKDQTMALRWVHDNVHSFGGDPYKVTISGVSAGGFSVHYQVLTPHSKGLFSRAIMQSGSALCPWARGGAFREAAQYAGQVVGCPDLNDTVEFLRCLQAVPTHSLTALPQTVMVWGMDPFLFGPRVDGDYLPDDPRQLVKDGRHQNVDVISGVTRHEGNLMSHLIYMNKDALASFNANLSVLAPISLEFDAGDVAVADQTRRIFEYYTLGSSLTVDDADHVVEMMSDRHFRVPHEVTVEHLARTLPPHNHVYSYLVTHRPQHSFGDMYPELLAGRHWVCHGDDMGYHFLNDFIPRMERDDDLKLRAIMMKLWVNFAATGNPTPDDSLGFRWAPLSERNNQHLDLNPVPSMIHLPRQQVRDFWSSLPLLDNIILNPEKVTHLAHYWLRATVGQRHVLSTNQGIPQPSDPSQDQGRTADLPLRKPAKVSLRDEL